MALEYKLSIVMIFLPAILVIAFSAPVVNKRNGGVFVGGKIQQFYCSAEVLKLQVKDMIKVNNSWLGTCCITCSHNLGRKSSCTTNQALE